MVKEWRVALGESIERARRQAKMTQEELSEAVGISRNTVGHFERGERAPDFDLLRKIAKAVSVELFEVQLLEINDIIRITFSKNGHQVGPELQPKQMTLDFDQAGGVTLRIEPGATSLLVKRVSA